MAHAQRISTGLLSARFGRAVTLADHEIALLHTIEMRPRGIFAPDSRLLAEGAEVRTASIIMSGWACYIRQLADGRRQVLGIVLPGDAIGLSRQVQLVASSTVLAITQVRVADASNLAGAWRDAARYPGLAAALDVVAAEDQHFLFGQITRLGRQTAYERLAHFFCELEYRLSSRGLSMNHELMMPMTQELIADVAGLSVVHVNRTLQQMRREGRIELTRSKLVILDLPALREAGEFHAPFMTRSSPVK